MEGLRICLSPWRGGCTARPKERSVIPASTPLPQDNPFALEVRASYSLRLGFPYVGGPKQYETYRQLRLKQKLADEQLEAAEMKLEAQQMDWAGWGGWGAWGPAWY